MQGLELDDVPMSLPRAAEYVGELTGVKRTRYAVQVWHTSGLRDPQGNRVKLPVVRINARTVVTTRKAVREFLEKVAKGSAVEPARELEA